MSLLLFNAINDNPSDVLPVTYTMNAARTAITVRWTPPAYQTGYMWLIDDNEILADGKRHFSFSDTAAQATIGLIQDGQPHSYSIKILGYGAEGKILI